jgi:hypothetical protein
VIDFERRVEIRPLLWKSELLVKCVSEKGIQKAWTFLGMGLFVWNETY